MVEELFEMYTNAKSEAISRVVTGNYRGYAEAMSFAFECKKLAADILGRPVIGFEF